MLDKIKVLFTAGSYLETYKNGDLKLFLYDGNVAEVTAETANYLLTTFKNNFRIVEDNKIVSKERHEEIMKAIGVKVKPVENKRLDSVGTGHQAEENKSPDDELKGLSIEEKAAYARAKKKATEGKALTVFEEQVVAMVEAAKG